MIDAILARHRRRVWRNGLTHQWALVLEAQPPAWPYGETLIFAPLDTAEDEQLKRLPTAALADALLVRALKCGVESHELTGDVRDIGEPRWLPIRADWTRVGDQAGLAQNRRPSPRPSPENPQLALIPDALEAST